jgi:hypothetical protein
MMPSFDRSYSRAMSGEVTRVILLTWICGKCQESPQ